MGNSADKTVVSVRYASEDNLMLGPDSRSPTSPHEFERALKSAAAAFCANDYQALVRDIQCGLVEIRFYDDGLVVSRNHIS